jgi:hypothetical protein
MSDEGSRDYSLPCLLGGSLLVVGSFLVPSLFSERLLWNDSLAVQMQRASMQYHAAFHSHTPMAANGSAEEPSFDEARRVYLQLEDKLQRAQSSGQRWGTWLRVAGVVTLVVGVTRYVWVKYVL